MADRDNSPLDLVELGLVLRAADAAAFFVPSRILRRVIKHDRQIAFVGLQVPHRKTYVIDRDTLLALAARDELEIEPERDLPPTVILIARPEPEALATMPRGPALIKYWRLLFHARVHVALAERRLTESAIHERVEAIGSIEFDEVRTVLRQEKYLLPPRDDRTTYDEFVAVYLELRYFDAALLPRYFPAIEDFSEIEALLETDVRAAELFAATRLAGAPEPAPLVEEPDQPHPAELPAEDQKRASEKRCRTALARADRAAQAGNVVRAAVERFRAARLAPSHRLADDARTRAGAALDRLVERLRAALRLTEDEAKDWRHGLTTLLPRAARGIWPAAARLLYDLQKVCVDFERPTFAPDLVEWAYSGFHRPLVRLLPNQPLVLAVKHLRGAVRRLSAIRLAAIDRHTLAALLHEALARSEHRLRERVRPVLADAIERADLTPQSFVEEVARNKLIEELLDHLIERGFLHIGDLRDALSSNDLKLPDLASPREFFAGGPILRANRALAVQAPGVYRRGEIYLRWMQRLSALAFGTAVGRWLMRFVVIPFGGAYATIVFAQEMLHLVRLPHHLHGSSLPIAVGALGVFFLLLMHFPRFRRLMVDGLRLAWRGIRGLLIDLPSAVYRFPPIRRLVESGLFQFLFQCIVKPLPVAALAWLAFWDFDVGPVGTFFGVGATLLATSLFVNSRLGRDLEELVADWIARRWEYIRTFVPGMVRWIADVFKGILETIERALYGVDEWLRFRGGQGRFTLAMKTILGFVWFLIAYIIRLYVNVFIEPTFNPLKHFPTVTVAAKLLVPFWIPITEAFATPFLFLGKPLAYTLATLGLHALPGAAGFLVWELKENWRLYRANRSPTLRPVIVGHHGESLVRLLKPGFHSGTLPKLYAKLRRAERNAHRGGSWRPVRRHLAALHQVEHSVRHFVERELLAFLGGSPAWQGIDVDMNSVEASSNRIRISLACPVLDDRDLVLQFELHADGLTARIAEPGWLPRLSPDQLAAWTTALAGFSQKAGVSSSHPIAWSEWVDAWECIRAGKDSSCTPLPRFGGEGMGVRGLSTG
jgi:hypothetical protein